MPLLQVTCPCGQRCTEQVHKPTAENSFSTDWRSSANYHCPACDRTVAQFQWRRAGRQWQRRLHWLGGRGQARALGCLAGIVEGAP